MRHARTTALIVMALASGMGIRVSGQSVVSTHSGVIYFFTGSVFLENQPLEQKFGRFPEIAEGGELRTTLGRAEVLLTPGVFLRLDQSSSMRMLSTSFADTRVELLSGSAIVEATEKVQGTAVRIIYRSWQLQAPQKGVFRIDAEPPQIRAYQGEVEVAAEGSKGVTLHEGEVQPLAAVLVPEPSQSSGNDDFKYWALIRSQAIAEDNTTAAGILDDPSQIDSSGLASAGYSYFPPTAIPSLDISTPYGLSFWSPYQSAFTSLYFSSYLYVPVYVGWPRGRLGNEGWSRPFPASRFRPYSPPTRGPRVFTFTPRPAVRMAPHITPRIAAPAGRHR